MFNFNSLLSFNTFGIDSVLDPSVANLSSNRVQGKKDPITRTNLVDKILRIHNIVLGVLGYIPGVSMVSGCVRMITGSGMIIYGAVLNKLNEKYRFTQENIIGTGTAQIARGFFEVIPYGRIVNITLDVVASYCKGL